MLEPSARSIDDAFEFVPPIGGGRVRGIVLHKLMEEFLTGELDDGDPCPYRKSNPGILMMETAQDRAADNSPGPLGAARERGILVQ
jgi:hypothetical protein